MASYSFEQVTGEHLESILDIYNYYVLNSTATFHTHPLTLDEMRELVFFDNPLYQAFIILDGEKLTKGYCILTQFKSREAYNGTAEVTVYLKHGCTGKGIGDAAVKYIEELAANKGIHALVASICGENSASIRLFEKNGYEKCAHFKEVGVKFGRMLDVVYYEKIL